MEEPISYRLEEENVQIKQKIADLETEISQKKKLIDYYNRKIWYNELMILKQPKPNNMSVQIERISSDRYIVNGKIVFKNLDSQWVMPSAELTPNEKQIFLDHIRATEGL